MLFSTNFYSLSLTLGFIAGRVLKPFFGLNTNNILSYVMVMVSMPLVIYQMCFLVDIHNWFEKRNIMLSLVIIPGWFVSIPVIAFVTKSVLGTICSWDYETYFAFSICCTMHQLQKVYEGVIPVSMNIRGLLQIEQLVVLIPANLALTLTLTGVSCHTILAPMIISLLCWNLLALIVGIVLGKAVGFLLNKYFTDAIVFASLLLFVVCPTFYYGQTYFGSGILFSLFALMASTPNKLYCTREVRACSNFCCQLLIVLMRTIAFTYSGFIVGSDPEFVSPTAVVGSFAVFIASAIGRGCLHMIIKLVFLNCSYPYPSNGYGTLIFGVCASELSLLYALLFRYYNNYHGHQVLTLICFVVLYSSILTGTISLFLGGFYSRNYQQNKLLAKAILDSYFNKYRGICLYDTAKMHNLISELTKPKNGADDIETDIEVYEKSYLSSLRKIYKIESIYHWKEWKKGKISYWCLAKLRILIEKKMTETDCSMRLYHIKCTLFNPRLERFLKVFINYILGKIYEFEENKFHSGEWSLQYMLEIESTLFFKLLMAFTVSLEIILLTIILNFRNIPNGLGGHIWTIEILYMFLFCFSLAKLVTTVYIRELGISSKICRAEIFDTLFAKFPPAFISVLVRLFGGISPIYCSTIIVLPLFGMCIYHLKVIYLFAEYFWKGILLIVKYFLDRLNVQQFEIGKLCIAANRNSINMLHFVETNAAVYKKVFNDLEREECFLHAWLKYIEVRKPCLDYTLNTRINTRMLQIFFTRYTNNALSFGNVNPLGQHTILKSLNFKAMFFSKPGVCLEGLLSGIAWINSNSDIISIISKASRFVMFSPNQKIINAGEFPAGMYIIINGLARCEYVPSNCTITNFVKYGLLPNCDYLDSITASGAKMSYIHSGGVIGEIGAVTGRSYDMDVICETSVHVVYIPYKCVTEIVWKNECSKEIRANIWKCVAIKICKILFRHLPQYKSWVNDDIYSYLNRGTVFELRDSVQVDFKEDVTDIILIEGRVVDDSTMNVFYAPYYLPKMARRLILPQNRTSFAKGRSCPPQFFFIPAEPINRSLNNQHTRDTRLSQFIFSPPKMMDSTLSFETHKQKPAGIKYRVKDFEITMKMGQVYESPIALLIKETVVKKTPSSCDKEEQSFMSTTDIWLTEPEVGGGITKNAVGFIAK